MSVDELRLDDSKAADLAEEEARGHCQWPGVFVRSAREGARVHSIIQRDCLCLSQLVSRRDPREQSSALSGIGMAGIRTSRTRTRPDERSDGCFIDGPARRLGDPHAYPVVEPFNRSGRDAGRCRLYRIDGPNGRLTDPHPYRGCRPRGWSKLLRIAKLLLKKVGRDRPQNCARESRATTLFERLIYVDRAPKRMIAAPMRITAAPVTSHRSGRAPSSSHSQPMEATT